MTTSEETLKMMKDAMLSNQRSIDDKIAEEEDSTSDAITYLKQLKKESKEKELEAELASLEAQEEQDNALSDEEIQKEIARQMLEAEDRKQREEAEYKKMITDQYTSKSKEHDPAIEAAYINPEIGSHKTPEPPKSAD